MRPRWPSWTERWPAAAAVLATLACGCGSAWAWDIKVILVKTLFALALGPVVFALTRHRDRVPAAALLAAALWRAGEVRPGPRPARR
ncbi:MAG: hypothetical protein ACREFX_02145 [Opitutaceae bacterium]